LYDVKMPKGSRCPEVHGEIVASDVAGMHDFFSGYSCGSANPGELHVWRKDPRGSVRWELDRGACRSSEPVQLPDGAGASEGFAARRCCASRKNTRLRT
jgi:hypothetical protein